MEPTGNSTVSSDRKPIKKTVASSTTAKPNGKSTTSSAIVMKPNEKTDVSSANPMNPNAITALPSAHGDQVMLFRDVSLGPREAELMFRLIHFWEARNPKIKILIGQEMLLIDEEVQYRVADHSATVSFTWNSALNVLENPPVLIPEDRFRFHSYEEFKANCDSKDYVGHMKLVNGQTVTEHTVLDEIDIAEKRHLCVHVQTHDEPVMKLYLWDKAATDFCQKFKLYGSTPSVLLVTTVNPKHLGGTLALTTMSSSRVFMDADVQLSKDYLEWLSSNSEIANKIAAEVVTKPEPVTLEELFSYIRREAFKVAWFECTAIIDDVVQGSAWYYISCGGCNSKAVKGHTSLICNNKKCVIREVTGVAHFVILGDAGKELTGKHAQELVANYFETNEGVGVDACVQDSDHYCHKDTPTRSSIPASSDGISKTGGDKFGFEDAVVDRATKASEILESDETKRSKSG
ncbi:hypothetical protein Bca101_092725 [Brassica carinata]